MPPAHRTRLDQLWTELPDATRRSALRALSLLLIRNLRHRRDRKGAADDQTS
jgi:hypothetical protein